MRERILQVCPLDFGIGGVPTITWRWGKYINSNRYVFDYVGWKDAPESKYTEVIRKLGGHIYSKKVDSCEVIKEIRQAFFLKQLIKDKGYRIIHIQGSNTLSQFLYSLASKLGGAKKIIVHAHTAHYSQPGFTGVLKRISHEIFKQLIPFFATDFLACSSEAGKWYYPPRVNVKVINNGIEVENFAYNQEVRNKIRYELWGGNEYFVIGHVGRFSYQKNHKLIIEVFEEVYKIFGNARLLLIGQGELEDTIHTQIKESGLDAVVCHIRSTPHVNLYMQAMDCFLFPSLYEGQALTLLESQAAGLPTVVSEEIPKEAQICDLIYVCQLSQTVDAWARVISKIKDGTVDRSRYADVIRKSGFSIETSAMEIEKIYAGIGASS